jgi:lipoprotein-anchoring transpeptidase ErfK/SrfK
MTSSFLFILLSLFVPLLAQAAPRLVAINIANVPAGSIVIKERERALYFKLDENQAIRYPVAVPRASMRWSGQAYIESKHLRPAWSPPAVVKRANPHLPDLIPGGAPGNPMGAAALLLNLEEIAIHGTSRSMRGSIGSAASFGCIRMLNEDVLDLYDRVQSGTPVYMVP